MDDIILTVWNAITSYIPAQYLGIVGTIVLLANLITMNIKTTAKTAWLKYVKVVLNVLALNIRKNRNKDDNVNS